MKSTDEELLHIKERLQQKFIYDEEQRFLICWFVLHGIEIIDEALECRAMKNQMRSL